MIGPLNVLLVILFMIIVPFILGLLLERFFEASGSTLMFSRCLLCGFAIMLATFQIVAVPMIRKNTTFNTLMYVYIAILVVLIALSLATNVKTIKNRITESVSEIKAYINSLSLEQKIVGIAALAIIAFETSLLIFKMHTDTDDCRFLAEALDAVEKNSLLTIHPIKGMDIGGPGGEMVKDSVSPYPIWIAVMSVLTRIHPTVLAHSVFPVLLIPLAYVAAYLFGTFIFAEKKNIPTYMCILSAMILFSFESIYAWGYTLLSIIWQGRSIFAVVILPFVWYILVNIYTASNVGMGAYIVLFTATLSGACLSGMGMTMVPVLCGIFAFLDIVRNKRFTPAICIAICVIPNIIYMLLSYKIDWLIE